MCGAIMLFTVASRPAQGQVANRNSTIGPDGVANGAVTANNGFTALTATINTVNGNTATNNRLGLQGNTADGASAVAVKIGGNALTTAGANIACFYNASGFTNSRFCIDKDGVVSFPSKCDSSGTPGAATCAQAAGQAAIAASASSVTITNSIVTTTSIIHATLQAQDTTCVAVKSVVPGSGTFTINTAATCTGNTKVGWSIATK